jgi:lipoate-protein ligase A
MAVAVCLAHRPQRHRREEANSWFKAGPLPSVGACNAQTGASALLRAAASAIGPAVLLLDLTLPTPAENLAYDEALLDWAESGAGGECLRFWEARETFVVVGYANRIASEVNVPACVAEGVPVLRRCSGGGTVLQAPGGLNYALVLRAAEGSLLAGINGANHWIMERHRAAFEGLLGRPVRVQGHTDLTLDGRKFSGNSQRRRRKFLLFHGTLLLACDLSRIERLLAMPSKEPEYRAGRRHLDFITNLRLQADVVKATLRGAWDAGISHPAQAPPLPPELLARYTSREWNWRH